MYRRERCGRCHTLERPAPHPGESVLPGGPGDLAGRAGPDLGLEGHRHSDDWHFAHLYAPAAVVPGTRMPAYRHLFAPGAGGVPAPNDEGLALVAFLQSLGREGVDQWAEWRARDPIIPPPAGEAAPPGHAVDLYRRHCAGCHGEAGDGRGPAAPLLKVLPRDFTAGDYRFRSSSRGATDADLFRSITLGSGTGAAMPAFYWLPARDRWALVLLVRGFAPGREEQGEDAFARTGVPGSASAASGGPGIPADDAGPGAGGRGLWNDLGCGACHGDDGRGLKREEAGAAWTDEAGNPVPATGDLTDPCALRGGASSAAVERAIRFGTGGVMPAYGEAVATEEDLARLVAFVVALRRSDVAGPRAVTSPRTPDRR